MRKVRYSVAMSLDGYIAGPGGSYDWIPSNSGIDWSAFMSRFDTVLMGRRTYEVLLGASGESGLPSMRTYVFSRTLDPTHHPDVTVVSEDAAHAVRGLREEEGKEIWLMGGGELFRTLLDADQVDAIEVGLVPALLGGGIPFLPAAREWHVRRLSLTKVEPHGGGMVLLTYDVLRDPSS